LRVLDQGIDTTTAAGRMLFHVLAALAEFEASLISKRTPDGLEAARARGRKGGRRPKLSERQVAMVRQRYASGEHTVSAIAETFNMTRPTTLPRAGLRHRRLPGRGSVGLTRRHGSTIAVAPAAAETLAGKIKTVS
jgi:DNA invertase Pin-like site-specific DNA recombinase